MKKIYMILAAITLLSMSLNAQTSAGNAPMRSTNTVTFTAGTNTANAKTITLDGVTITNTQTQANNNSFSYNPYRFYNGTLDVSTASGTITKIVFDGGNNTSRPVTYLSTSTGDYTTSNNNVGTWTGDAASVSFNVGGQVRVSSIEVTYEIDDNTETATLDIFSDTQDANTCLPVYGGYHDHTQHNQMVYPASMLTDMVGKRIKSMTFYPASVTYQGTTFSGIGFRNGSVTFKLMEETGSTGFDSSNPSFITGSMTTVKTVNMPSTANTSATTWLISFDQPFEYNGGDLVIDVTNTTGDYRRTYFYTGTTSIAYPGYYTYSGSQGSDAVAVDYLPKVSFTYEYDLNKTAKPVITYEVNGDNVVITATGNGTVNLSTSDGQTATGTGSASITVPRTDATYSVTATATAQEADKEVSDPATETITVPFLQTSAPTISGQVNGDNYVITATGDGTVYLTVNGETVSGNGTASVTVPRHMSDYNIPVSAYAQESGKAASETVNQTETVPGKGNEGWTQMDGDYTNPNTLLSFTVDNEEIMLVDQFTASTMYNKHPDGYTYTLRETIEGEEKSSSPVDIPVYKSSSTMQGFYTFDQVMSDEDMHLKAQVINSEMSYEVNPDHNTLYHSLYRSDLNGDYPVIDVQHRVSQLQKYEENDNGTVNYYFTEMHTSGVTPKYDHVAHEIVSPLDTNYVQGIYNDELSYVPVIWTFGLYTGREDGKNNSYGSDIKREKLGDVNILNIGGSFSGNNNEENTGNGWEGNFKVGDVPYCIYSPEITIEGISPETLTQHDGDVTEYEPYMYRAWCLYEGARDFKHVAQQNSQGNTVQVLADNGPLTIPYLMGTNIINESQTVIGSDWTTGSGRLQSSFAVPVGTQGSDIKFAVRFYYKKKVTEGAQRYGAKGNRDGENDAEYYIVEETGDGSSIPVSINEFMAGKSVIGVTYVNALGMQSNKPFDGVNIVVTKYSDGTTTTTKVLR